MKFLIDMFAIVEAKDKKEAESIAFDLVNCDLPSDIEKKLLKFSYEGGFEEETIREYDELFRGLLD